MICVPEWFKTNFNWPVQEPVVFGIAGSLYLAFGLLSILGLRSPLKFVPILMVQLCYKSIWFIGIILPLLITGRLPSYVTPMMLIVATYIIGDLIAIPFSRVFER